MDVKSDSKHKTAHEGTDYYFCCEGCLKKFEADPAAALAKEATSDRSITYTDPVCGMYVKSDSKHKPTHESTDYFFLSPEHVAALSEKNMLV